MRRMSRTRKTIIKLAYFKCSLFFFVSTYSCGIFGIIYLQQYDPARHQQEENRHKHQLLSKDLLVVLQPIDEEFNMETATTTESTSTSTRTIGTISHNKQKQQVEGGGRGGGASSSSSWRRRLFSLLSSCPLSSSWCSSWSSLFMFSSSSITSKLSSRPPTLSSSSLTTAANTNIPSTASCSSSSAAEAIPSFALMGNAIICELKKAATNEDVSRVENTGSSNHQQNVLDNTVDSKVESTTSSIDDNTTSSLQLMPSRDHSVIFVIAVVPLNLFRLLALWSQLECFISEKKFDTILIAAPKEMTLRKRGFLDRFVQHAVDSIPHLKNIHVSVKYYQNDWYDVGLWCDALRENAYHGNDEYSDNLSDLISRHDEFVLTNDSIMAIQPNFTGVLDALQEDKNLSMTSLNYSFLRGAEGDYSFSHNPWLESVFRAFNRDGLERYMNHACDPASHSKFCPQQENVELKRRCIVESMEIQVADLFGPNEVKGLFPSDVPRDMIKSEALEHVFLWHSHFNFWRHDLVDKMKFPAMKISNEIFVRRVVNRSKGMFFKCTKFLDPFILEDVQKMFY